MHSPHKSRTEDRTAKAIIRDTAIELFGRNGADAVSLRSIAEQAAVSQPLIIKHYGSRDGLVAAADEHVLDATERLLQAIATDEMQTDAVGTSIARVLGESPVGTYLARLLTGSGERAQRAFARLAAFARALVDGLAEAGAVGPGVDRGDLAVVLLTQDLAVLLLRARITEALGADPLGRAGGERWLQTVDALYAGDALHTRAAD